MSILLGYLIMVLPGVTIVSLLLYLPVHFVKRKKYGKRPFKRHFANFTFIVVLLSILYVTFGTILIDGYVTLNPEHHYMNLVPFIWMKQINEIGITEISKQVLINLIMLIPAGFILPVVFKNCRKWWKTVLCIVAFIVCIETFQYFIGRRADVDDLIFNTIGGLIGYGVFAILNNSLHEKTFWKKANYI